MVLTISNRIAAIKSFMQYVTETAPEYSAINKRAFMLPVQKHELSVMSFITKEEFNALIQVCDTNTFIGARDKLMLLLMYNTGVRVSELLVFIRTVTDTSHFFHSFTFKPSADIMNFLNSL